MSATATLVYGVVAQGPVQVTDLEAALGLVPLENDYLQLGVTLNSDTTGTIGTLAFRTVVFSLDPTFNFLFPVSSDQKGPFRDLYTHVLGRALSSKVTANDPLIA